jgi:hypothetical protein
MQPRFSSNRARLIPIAIGVVLILGLGWILASCDRSNSPIPATATPSSLSSLKAGMLTQSPSAPYIRDEDEPSPTATGTGPDASPGPSAETLPVTSTLTETPATPSATTTPDFIQSLRGGKYDDVDPNIAYDPYWTGLKNPSTTKAYHDTIHASDRIGSEASFRFTGKRFSLGYKRGKNFGTVTVMVDDQSFSFYEQAFDLVWHSPNLSPGDHFVRIIHESGESINLDYIVIVE